MTSPTTLIHDRSANRFRLPLKEGGEAYVEYAERGEDTLDLLHTVVPPESRGRGHGSEIVEQVLRYAREHGLQITPSCPFVAAYLKKHPEHADLAG